MNVLKTACFLLLSCLLLTSAHAAPPEVMLPQTDTGECDVSGWLMSEKLDGVRGYWDGRRLLSKNGTLLHPPEAFVRDLPDFALEGELWGGRGTFEETSSIVLRQEAHDGWLRLKFAIFDVPEAPGGFTRRIEKAREWFAGHPSGHAFVIPQIPVRDRSELQRELKRVEELGGEGLIVRDPEAPYAGGRSPEILKVKSFQDAEARVLAHVPGRGRNEGALGSLLVELPDKARFRIGTGFSDEERRHPPSVGAVITFKHYGYYRSGIPKFPSFLRIREDHALSFPADASGEGAAVAPQ